MRNLLISLAILTNLSTPVLANTLLGGVQQTQVVNQPRSNPQYGLISSNQFNSQVQQDRTVIQANINGYNQPLQPENAGYSRLLTSKVDHGCQPVGVIGIRVSEDLGGAIIEEYEPSNLWNLGVQPGDRVVAVEGQPVNFITFEQDCRGIPGQARNLTIVSQDGEVRNINVRLIDARALLQYNKEYSRSASLTRYW